jgi:hypothetical protein
MTSRRQFLAAGAAASLFTPATIRAGKTTASDFPYAEFDARIARRDLGGGQGSWNLLDARRARA